ncbi:MAG: dual specificity protein phosphatase family protein [Anaerolineae bacterium]|nr:dual specificity protein phosphatase family protein [Anaerolineae bacterium]
MTDQPKRPFFGAYWVRPRELLAGPYPGAWDEHMAQNRINRLLAAGVTTFIDLTEQGEVSPYAPWLPRHVRHVRFDIPDMDVPSDRLMIDILNTLDGALARGEVPYVHCLGGIGRTGTVIGCFLVRHGLSGQEALDEIIRLRDGRLNSPQTDEQARMIRTWTENEESS